MTVPKFSTGILERNARSSFNSSSEVHLLRLLSVSSSFRFQPLSKFYALFKYANLFIKPTVIDRYGEPMPTRQTLPCSGEHLQPLFVGQIPLPLFF